MIEKGLVYFLKTGVKIPYFVLLAQVAQAHYESPEQHYPTLLINY